MPVPIVPTLPVPSNPSHSILDATKIQSYQECPRRFFFEYVLGWRSSRPSNHLVFGQAVHRALEHIILNGYTAKAVVEAYDLFMNCYRAKFPESTDEIFSPKTPARFLDMITMYCNKYRDDLEIYEVYKTELGGTISLGPDHKMAWKMDTIMYNRERQNYFSLEHKTSSGNYIPQNYAVQFEMGIQAGTYTHVLNSLFPPEDVYGVIINCMCFKKTVQPQYLLERFPIPMSNVQMYNWVENTKAWIDQIYTDYAALANVQPDQPHMKCFRQNGKSCTNWSRVCEFYNLCTSWNNPVAHQKEIPMSMEISFWNPLEEELREVLTI